MTSNLAGVSSSQSTEPRLTTLHVLGGFSLRDSDGKTIELKARKNRQLLAYLAVPSGQTRTREQLAALLWSDRQDEQARGSLRTALSGIRRAIGDDALVIDQDTVRLRTEYLDSDYDHLLKLSASTSISKLSDFYAGEFLAGHEHDSELFTEWLRGLRHECTGLALSVLEENADRFKKAGDFKPAIDLMREGLSLEPLKEQTHRTIMQLYAASGEKAMALAQFRTCKELLLHELDTSPDPETEALADSIALRDVSVSKELRRHASLIPEEIAPLASMTSNTNDNLSSIAVLPFVNMSGDAEQNYFADGITEDIIIDLSDIETLSVAAKCSSEMYRGAAVSPARISEELGVHYILEGSIRKSGDSVRISALLVDGSTSRQVWAKRYDRKLENIFELQSEISQEIVKALELNLTGVGKHTTDRRTTSSVEAYQYYLQGRTLLRGMSHRSIALAQGLFERAIALDPNYALAYTGLADCATTLFCHYDVDPNYYDKALAASEKAIEIDPTLAEGYASRGYIVQFSEDIHGSIENFEKAILLNPKFPESYYYLGFLQLGVLGDVEKAYFAFKQTFALDQDISAGMMVLTCLNALDYPTELKSFANQVLVLAQRRISLNPHDFDAMHVIAHCLHSLDRIDEAQYWANVATSFDSQDARSVYNLACLQSQLGAIDECLGLLEQVFELGCSKAKIHFLKVLDPDLEAVRKDSRFDEIIVRYAP